MSVSIGRFSIALLLTVAVCTADDPAPMTTSTTDAATVDPAQIEEMDQPAPLPPLPDLLAGLLARGTPLNPEQTAFLDSRNKTVLLRTRIACADCALELLCCREGIREHESILAYRGQAYVVHAALLAVGAVAGEPVRYQPEFKAPSGHELRLYVNWVDNKGKLQRADARSWIRHTTHRYFAFSMAKLPDGIKVPVMEMRYDPYNNELLWYGPMSKEQRSKLLAMSADTEYQKAIHKFYRDGQSQPMVADFVFTGSYSFRQDFGDGHLIKQYAAESGGYVICVANFPESTIDVREASSATDGGQTYEGWQGRVPASGTPVILEIIPAAQPASRSATPTTITPADVTEPKDTAR